MISYFKNLEANKLKAKSSKLNKGFTYVELIVVLGIFAVISAVIIYNYGAFQSKVDIKSLASDIASKIVEAQKSSLNGLLPAYPPPFWKPSYGVYFNSRVADDANKKFVYFVDLSPGDGYSGGSEKLDTILITKGNFISRIDECLDDACSVPIKFLNPGPSVVFTRPSSGAVFYYGGSLFNPSDLHHIQITIESPRQTKALIKIYPSGRIQVN